MKKVILMAIAGFILRGPAIAQIPVEVFGGHEKTTFDLMFFKNFKNKEGKSSPFLFFNRNRTSLDYRQTTTTYLPQFGFTEAISYNSPKLKGFAPVFVVQILNRGISPKLGVQLFKRKNDFTLFSWVVAETLSNPNIDWFIMTRFEPRLNQKLKLFSQLEVFSSAPTSEKLAYSFLQRARLGLKINNLQFGVGADFTESGRTDFINTQNIGGFLRTEF
jgi:hypothetical protein